MDILLPIRVVGGIVGFWGFFFLGSRTAYHPSMRWLRWSFVFAGFHFLFVALESPLASTTSTAISLLCCATGLIAIAFWHGWLVGVRGLARTERIVRKVHLGVAVGYALVGVVISLIPADGTFIAPTIDPLVAPVLIGVYLAGALSHIWVMTWRLHHRETIPVVCAASRAVLIATTIIGVSVIAVAAGAALRQSLPEVALLIAHAGYGALSGGMALVGYGAQSYTERHMGRTRGRDYLFSGIASLGIVGVYEGVLIAFWLATSKVWPVQQALILGIILIPVIVATHFGFDQLRDMLDWLRFGASVQRVRGTLRTITRQIGSAKPRDQVLRDVLQALAHDLRAERTAIFWFKRSEAHLLAAYGQKPDSPVQADALCAARLKPLNGFAGYEDVLPLCTGRKQHGALLIGGSDGWRWTLDERERLEAIGVLLADYIAHTASEPVTIPQHLHRLEEQTRDVQALHAALDQGRSPSVFITTLGSFQVEVRGQPASYKAVRVGRHMLNGMLMYLVANVDKTVRRDALIDIALDHRRGRKPDDVSSPDGAHYISGLRQILGRWGMADALEISDTTVMLKRHPSWTTDTDQVLERYRRAKQEIADGRIDRAILWLKEARALFKGDYLPDFDAADHRIERETLKWERECTEIERFLLECYADYPDDAIKHEALDTAHSILSRYEDDGDMLRSIEHVAQRFQDHRLLQRCRALLSDCAT
ncbi:hypothetical protein [Roseiflexus castenholzii]|uniref:AfsR/SARP family transcriptional regulator n=1 Tax=Roseiflexus castenholzii TaxID=120962 RepID=UPI003C7E5A65